MKEISGGFSLDQPMLIEKIINYSPSAIQTRTRITSTELVSNPSMEMKKDYLLLIGFLLYLAQGSCPDISFAVNFLDRFSMAPDQYHWESLEHLIAYIRYSLRLTLPIVSSGDCLDCIKTFVDAVERKTTSVGN